MSATLLKSKVFAVSQLLITYLKPIAEDLTSPALLKNMEPNVAKTVNTAINLYCSSLALDKNEHTLVQYLAKGVLLAPAHSPLKVLCSIGVSTGWLTADSKLKAITKRIAVSGGLALAFSTKLSLGK